MAESILKKPGAEIICSLKKNIDYIHTGKQQVKATPTLYYIEYKERWSYNLQIPQTKLNSGRATLRQPWAGSTGMIASQKTGVLQRLHYVSPSELGYLNTRS